MRREWAENGAELGASWGNNVTLLTHGLARRWTQSHKRKPTGASRSRLAQRRLGRL
jgi:hypothetical protein